MLAPGAPALYVDCYIERFACPSCLRSTWTTCCNELTCTRCDEELLPAEVAYERFERRESASQH